MTKRLQVLLEESELRELRRIARARRMTVAAWVRQVVREARQREPLGDAAAKTAAVRTAARHAFPTADPDQMEAEIGRGYLDREPS